MQHRDDRPTISSTSLHVLGTKSRQAAPTARVDGYSEEAIGTRTARSRLTGRRASSGPSNSSVDQTIDCLPQQMLGSQSDTTQHTQNQRPCMQTHICALVRRAIFGIGRRLRKRTNLLMAFAHEGEKRRESSCPSQADTLSISFAIRSGQVGLRWTITSGEYPS
jgi:hypothetical protein